MKSIRLLVFAVVALAQLGVPAWAIWMRTETMRTGRVWKLHAEPVDPEDMIRGRYVTLAFTAERVPMADPLGNGDTAYAALKEGMDGFAVVDRLSSTPLHGDNVLKVERLGWSGGVQRVRFPFERFWITEQNARAAEQAYREQLQQKKNNVHVTIRVRDGDSALEQLFIDDKPIAEYLHGHATP